MDNSRNVENVLEELVKEDEEVALLQMMPRIGIGIGGLGRQRFGYLPMILADVRVQRNMQG